MVLKNIKNHLIISGDEVNALYLIKKSMIGIFGGIKNKFHQITSVAVNSTTLYDSLNKFVIDLENR